MNKTKPLNHENSALSSLTSGDSLKDYDALNSTEIPYPNVALTDLLRKQAASTPNNIALEFYDSKITYHELDNKVNQLAHYLKAEGVETGDFIAISISRSPELLYTLLAIIQCGAAYLPLDPEYPKDRLEFMLTDSGAKALVTSKKIAASLPSWSSTLFIEDAMSSLDKYTTTPLSLTVSSDDLLYILYTSGSTGKPKGVTVTHKNFVNFLTSMAIEPGINKSDRLLSITTISFDIAGLELFLPLLVGATLVIIDDATARDGRLLNELLVRKNISILQATPTTWQMLLDLGWKTKLPLKVLCGGESLPLNLAQELISKCDSLWNMYGPTETTVWSALKQIKKNDKHITIGKPIANTQIYLLNEQGQLVSKGTIGEITIGGDSVALGYWNRLELTNEKFIKDPFRINNNNNNVLYKTGDLGKLLPNGEIQCLGRMDQQVKIRGHRIELGEIEQALTHLVDIHAAVVLADCDSLIAYVVPNKNLSMEAANSKITEWKNALKMELPKHLVPNTINLIESLPTTLNGKIDRKALLKPEVPKNKVVEFTLPRNKTEQIVADIWQNCLEIDQIDIFSDFFELGGHSLIAVKMMSLIEEKTKKRLPLSSLFEYSTVEKLSILLNMNEHTPENSLIPMRTEGNKSPIYFIHGAGLNVLIFNQLVSNMSDSQPAFALDGTNLTNIDDPSSITMEEIATNYVDIIVKANPNGPYAIAGYSFGGFIAFEMARQLVDRGKKVSMLAILDTYVSPQHFYLSPIRKKLAGLWYRNMRRLTYFKEMVGSLEKAKVHFNRKKDFLLHQYLNKKRFETIEKEVEHQQYLKVIPKINNIINRYRLTPHNLEIDLFRANSNDDFKLDNTYFGWKEIALKGVNVYDIPGGHLNIFDHPNVIEFANLLQNVLDIRQAKFQK